MTQYDVVFLIEGQRGIRTLSLMTGTEEEAIQELRKKGLANKDVAITIVAINERFGMC